MLARALPLIFVLGLFAPALPATWSIILVNTVTGEVALGVSTCLTGFDLARWVPVIVVGKGAGAAQSFVNPAGTNRLLIRDQLRLGTDPLQILQLLKAQDPAHQTRQYGIVDGQGRAIGFSGTGAGSWAGDRTGRQGDIVYAVQGNVLTGAPVLAAAELAIWSTKGSVTDKLMAAMQAARQYGGDGRCSCIGGAPTACGSPPANFTKSAHVGTMIAARLGDIDGGCNGANGCATGQYYMHLNVAFQGQNDPDPVAQLQALYDSWKLAEQNRPDHFNSRVSFAHPNLPIDGQTQTTATVSLVDRYGKAIIHGGAKLTATLDPSSPAAVTTGTITDNGNGTYSIPVTAGVNSGKARIQITVDDGKGGPPRQLYPAAEISLVPDRLWADRQDLSIAQGGAVNFAIQPGAGFGKYRNWVLMAGNSGSVPGIYIPPFTVIPIVPDPLFLATVQAAFSFAMPELIGVLPANGITHTQVRFPAGLYGIPLGSDITFAYALWNPLNFASNAVNVRVVR